jgi:hypothetical protein
MDDLSALKTHLADSGRKLADLTAGMVYEKPSLLKSLLELTWLDQEPWSQRASRIISICSENSPELILPHVSEVIRKLCKFKSEGARRNFLKILMVLDLKLNSRDKTALLNACFDFLTGNYSVSVKVYSMDIIYKLSIDIPELQHELTEILTNQNGNISAGYKSRSLKIIKKIKVAQFSNKRKR